MKMLKWLSVAALLAIAGDASATVTTTANSVTYVGNGATTAFATTFPFQSNSDLVVTVAGVTKAINTDYTVSGQGNATGTVTFVAAPANLASVVITRTVNLLQSLSFRQQRSLDPSTVESVADKLTMVAQQLNNKNLSAAASTAAPTSIPNATNTNSAGVAPTLAASDHVHAVNFQLGSDPGSPSDGSTWFNSTQKDAKARINGATYVYAGNPAMMAYSSSGQSIANGSVVIVVFGTVERDTDSAYNSGTGRYTVPTGKGGDYSITASVMYALAQTGVARIHVYKNAAVAKSVQWVNPGATQALQISAILNLAAGDVVDIRTDQPAGSPQSTSSTGVASFIYFQLKRLSD